MPPDEGSTRALVGLTDELANALAKKLAAEDHDALAAIFRTAIERATNPKVFDLWEQRDSAITYWILMLTGVNQTEEIAIAKDLLVWQAFFAKESARILCVQSSERAAFRSCAAQFRAHNCPTLAFSDSPLMESYIKIDPALLASLSDQPGGLQRFFTKIHTLFENGYTLKQVQEVMLTDAFYRGLKVLLKEAKGLIYASL